MLNGYTMYLRVKRHSQTFFITCDPGDTIRHIKEQVAIATKNELKPDDLRLLLPNKKKGAAILKDEDTLQTLEIKSDTVLHMVSKISDNEWEPVDVYPDPISDKSS
ncbi:unnamed protein product [Cylindrotheca closterium]|uniref:Ubiquitin-like domain-containing protein n=1 Tax=Cylindrotheca closterium TaxID=2856 RepID=A0AAD2CGV5_9STRA|nr:unnamed protein product [Cylindrotheca closterium]